MAYDTQASFSSGELDPALRERTTLQKFQSGLATARNVIIGKTGRILSRPGRAYVRAVHADIETTSKIILHPLSDNNFVEVGANANNVDYIELQVQDYDAIALDGTISVESEDLLSLSLIMMDTDSFALAARNLGAFKVRDYTLNVTDEAPWETSYSGVDVNTSSGTGTGYNVNYMATHVIDGVERFYGSYTTPAGLKLPITSSTNNNIVWESPLTVVVDYLKVYRQPEDTSGWGFIGIIESTGGSSGAYLYDFTDYGQAADFSQQPPKEILDNYVTFWQGCTSVCVHQGRMCASNGNEIATSMSGELDTGLREFPYTTNSSILTTVGEKGVTEILWMISRDDLIVFTTTGVYVNTGTLSFDNLAFTKKGDWLIDETIPPVLVPGGLMFIDANTNTVRELNYSNEKNGYAASEVSIFSDHLFSGSKVTSWAFQGGEIPILYVTFSDGTAACFTYEEDHLMRAWTRLDSFDNIEYVASLRIESATLGEPPKTDLIFVTKYGSNRYIERSVDRYASIAEISTNTEYDKGESIAAMDSMVSWSHLILDDLTDDDMVLTPVIADTWDGDLTLSVTDDAIFPDPGIGAVGTIFKWFSPIDRTEINLTVTARASDDSITVSPDNTFPSTYATNARLYETKNLFSGLDHLDGLNVSIVADGYVFASPNNDIENYTTVTPSSGSIALPDAYFAAIVHIGLPFTSDIETLEIATLDQKPTTIESTTVNKLYIKTKDTRVLYVGNRFPDDDMLLGDDTTGTAMVELNGLDAYDVNYEDEDPILGNRYDQPVSKRVEMTLPGDWKTNGKVAIRNVDPIHFEILSITPDADVQWRS